jgi:hypothetical protein
MTNDKGDAIREALLSRLEPSEELGNRFQEQVDALLRRRLKAWEKLLRVAICAVFVCTALWFAYIAFFAVTVKDKGWSDSTRTGIAVIFSLGALLFLAGAAGCLLELRKGRIAPRRMQQGIVGSSQLFMGLFAVFTLVFVPQWNLPLSAQLWFGVSVLFFWVMAEANFIIHSARWHREDIILEQKRTQLEIAMLREELTRQP